MASAGAFSSTPRSPFAVHLTDDPQTNVMGWSHAFSVRHPDSGEWVFMPLMGHNHAPDTENSVRVYRPRIDSWEFWQPDLGRQLSRQQWFDGASTDPPSASGRNNYIGFYLPWEGEAGQLWIAAPGSSLAANHGIFDIAERAWVRLRGNRHKPDFAPVEYRNETAMLFVNGWNFLDASCDSIRTLVRYGGKQEGVLITARRPEREEPYSVTGWGNQPPGRRDNVSNSGFCRDGELFLFGGSRTWGAPPTSEVWRLNVESKEWSALPETPDPIPGSAVVTHDPGADQALILFSDGTNRIGTYDLGDGSYRDLTEILDLPTSRGASGAFIPGVGHLYRGGEWGSGGWTSHQRVYCVSLDEEQSCSSGR